MINSISTLGRRGGLLISALDSGLSGPGSIHGGDYCVVFLNITFYYHRATLHLSDGIGEFNSEGRSTPAMDLTSIPSRTETRLSPENFT